jgi:hypothetical protein
MRTDRLPADSRVGRHLMRLARSWSEAGQLDGQHRVQTLRQIEKGYRQCGQRWAAKAVRQQIRQVRTW